MIHKATQQTNPVPTVMILDTQPDENTFPELGKAGRLGWNLAGKPLIKYILEELNSLHVVNCFLLSSGNAQSLSDLIKDELHWTYSMRVEALNLSMNSKQASVAFASLATESGLLIIETDLIADCSIGEFLSLAYAQEGNFLRASSRGQPLGLTLLKPKTNIQQDQPDSLNLERRNLIQLDSRSAFVSSNLSLLAGKLRGRTPRLAASIGTRFWQHNRSHLSRNSKTSNVIFLDRGVHVARGCELDNAVVFQNSVVEENVHLHNSIVLPDSWVSRNQQITNAIVSGEDIIPIDS